ncbi:MAG: choice-of-anchor Q domain-containing protein [Thermoguttaceae bacterium]
MFTLFRNFLAPFASDSKTTSSQTISGQQRGPHFRSLSLEPLEDRCLLAILYVNADSPNPGGNGSSWNTACSSLQRALELADNTTRNITEIWVAKGVYTPESRTVASEPRTETFTLRDGISIYGGFLGTESQVSQRQIRSDGSFVYETLLSGDLVGNDSPDNLNTLRDNAYTVLSGSSLARSVVIDGLTISGGYSVLTSSPNVVPTMWTSGGGVTFLNCSSVTLNQVVLVHNSAQVGGGAVYVEGGTVSLQKVQIHNNSAQNQGGGIQVVSGSVNVTGSSIYDNYAVLQGGGVYQGGGTVSIVDSMFYGNTSWFGGGYYQHRGNATLKNSSLIGNIADHRGAVAGEGGGLYQNGTMSLINVTFSLNTAGYGGAICTENPVPSGIATGTYSSVTISKNIATISGGGIQVNSGSYIVNNSIIAANSAPLGFDVYGETKPVTTLGGSCNLIGVGAGLPELPTGSTAKAIKNQQNGNQVGSIASPLSPNLGAPTVLGNNGVYVLPLISGSPAIQGGNVALIPSGVTTDARGAQRTSGSGASTTLDLGAVQGSTTTRNAVTYRVNSLENAIGVGPGILTLREALEAANSNKQVGNAPAGSFTGIDVIEIATDLRGTFVLNGRTIQLFDGLTLKGSGMSSFVLDAQNQSGLIKLVGSFNVSLSNMTLENGCADHNGGGIEVYSSRLTLSNVVVRKSSTVMQGYGGGVYVKNGTLDCTNLVVANCSAKSGGGVYLVNATATFVNLSLYDNRSSEEAGALGQQGGTSVLANATIARNESPLGAGLMFVEGTARLTHLTVTKNASENTGGMYVGSNARISLFNSIIADNFSYNTPDVYVYTNSLKGEGVLSGTRNLIGNNTNLKGLSTTENKIGTAISPLNPGLLAPSFYLGQLIYPLAIDSPALDYGDVLNSIGKGTSPLTNDIRGTGYNRQSGVRVDLGSTERQRDVPIPVISANTSTLRSGQTLEMTGSLSGTGTFTYYWDLNNNGIYGEVGLQATQGNELGKVVTFDSTGLEREPGSAYKVRLIVVDSTGRRSEPTEYALNVISGWCTYELEGPRTLSVNQMQEWTLSASNALQDPIVHWTITWGDGTPNTVLNGGPRNTVRLLHTYRTTGVFSVQVTTESYYGDKRTFTLTTFQVSSSSGTQSFANLFAEQGNEDRMIPELSSTDLYSSCLPVQKDEHSPNETPEVDVHFSDVLLESPLFNSLAWKSGISPNSIAADVASLDYYTRDGLTFQGLNMPSLAVQNVCEEVKQSYIPTSVYEQAVNREMERVGLDEEDALLQTFASVRWGF